MRPEGTVEYNSLSWVKKQLDTVLSDAQSALSEYVENHDDTASLQQCIEHLRLVFGTLQMVEVYGAAMLAEEMEHTTQALLDEEIDKPEDAYDVLMRAMLQLPDYLEGLQAGNKDTPVVLMPLMNDLRAARKESLLSESVVFLPDVDTAEVETLDLQAPQVEAGKLADEAKRLRTHYQLGMLDVLRNNKEAAGLRRMAAVISSLEKVSANPQVRRLWIVIASLFEALTEKGIENGISVKMLLGAVDRQIKNLVDSGEEAFADGYSRELLKNILYYVGRSTTNGVLVSKVKQAYKLGELLPAEEEFSGFGASMTGFNAELFDTVSQGIREDLTSVKDSLEIFMHSSDKDVQQLESLPGQLEKIADTYAMLGMGAVRQKVVDQREAIEAIIKGEANASEQHVMDIAGSLLAAEAELDNYIAEKSGLSDSDLGGESRVVPASEYRKVLAKVVSEALNNFTEAKDAVLSYAAGIGGKEQLEIILQRLEEVRGATMMLPMTRVEQLIEQLKEYIQVAFMQHNRKPEPDEQDTIADVVTSIEYYLESVAEGRPGVDIGLQAGEAAAARLIEVVREYDGVAPVEPDEPTEVVELSDIEEPAEEAEIETQAKAEAAPEPPPVAQVPVTKEATSETQEEYEILGDDADDEIVEIFIEEGVEVLEALHEHLPKWKANRDDEESLTVVRRSFHTLKGSGRLIGAMLIGEFAWKIENMLNRVIEHRIEASDELFALLDEAISVLPQLIEQLKGNREPIPNIYQLMSVAEALSEGRTPDVSVETQAEQVAPETPEVEPEAPEEAGKPDEEPLEELVSLDAGEEPVDLESDEFSLPEEQLTAIAEDEAETVSLDVSAEPDTELDEFDISLEQPEEEEIDISAIEVMDELPAEEGQQEPVAETDNEDQAESIDLSMEALEEGSADEIPVFAEEDTIDVPGGEDLVIEIDETEILDEAEEGSRLDMDPMLFQIYYDESCSHLKTINDLLAAHESGEQELEAGKDIIRAFHTLYGSARTAEIEPIAEICGATEKYVKAREEAGITSIPEEAVSLIKEVAGCVEGMLQTLKDDDRPEYNKELHDRINRLVQQELQEQLQQSSLEVPDKAETVTVGDVEAEAAFEAEESVVTPVAEQAVEEEQTYTYGDVDDDLIDIFLEEAEELLEDCETSLRKIEEDVDDSASINELQRHMHTLKGGARMASLKPVGDLTHVLESMVIAVTEQKIEADKPLFEVVHESLDTLNSMLEDVKQRKPLNTVNNLVSRIELITSGEVPEKRAVERFDIEMEELSPPEEQVERRSATPAVTEAEAAGEAVKETPKRRASDIEEDRPHWGERATDVNYKDSQEQVRVRADLLNSLVNYAGEVNIHHARMGKQITDIGFNLKELNQTVIRLREQLRKLEIETEIQIRSSYEKEDDYDENFDPLEMDQYSTLQQLTRSLAETANDVESIKDFLAEIVSDSETLLLQESRISTDLQEGLMRTRMVRFGGMSTRLRRIVRQTARELGKEVNVEIIGEENEVDRTVLDRIVAPLEHMLRNAVAHGIETPEQRQALGKPEAGTIRINVGRQGPDVIVNVADDGRGINADAIRAKAIRQGLLEEDSPLTDHDVLQFILKSGFSTAEEVTQIAGRGVGMDVVDSEIKQLGGLLEIDTERGRGTTFKVRLPLTLAINQALLVSAGEDIYAIPLASIEGVVRITGIELQSFYDSGDLHYEFNGINYELKHMGKLLTGSQPYYGDQGQLFPVLLAKVGDQHFALHVDDLLGRREIVVKPVGLQIGTVRGIAGATILADGRVVLIIEMSALVVGESLFKQVVSEEEVAAQRKIDEEPTIMVVDDSITIRKVTTRILERNGMKVVSATDGVDATNQLQEVVPDLMLLDIEMPRMDGFELATYMRNDERLRQIPIIMITSRTGTKHKDRAMEIGVDQYLGKPYQEEELMQNINSLLDEKSA